MKKKLSEKMQKMNQKGFTLAELLIVVAIIAVLVAVAIPVFTSQLEKSREATDLANIRSAYSAVVAEYLSDNAAHSATVEAKQTKAGWETTETSILGLSLNNSATTEDGKIGGKTVGNSWTISIDTTGEVKIDSAATVKGVTVS